MYQKSERRGYLHTYTNSNNIDQIVKYIETIDNPKEYTNVREMLAKIDREGAKYLILKDEMVVNSLHTNIFEIKIDKNRFAYCYLRGNAVFILHAFRKGTQKTPIRDKKLAVKRYKEIKMKGF
ncbi:MAG: type II toxin-antitoxin system RelE/ParE family toxin [Bacillota bacterium]|nr:type II toxin-antitoxin system RelE/ParE family toxin [Bacillota bacterium]